MQITFLLILLRALNTESFLESGVVCGFRNTSNMWRFEMKGECEQHFVERAFLIDVCFIPTVSMVSVLLSECRADSIGNTYSQTGKCKCVVCFTC